MRVLVLSDIHGNGAALEAVISHAEGSYDKAVCLGDMVGYGPDPDECVERVLALCEVTLAGNHDLAACGRMGISNFSPHAHRAMEWTRANISSATVRTLLTLPSIAERWNVLLSHGSPAAPEWGYVFSEGDAAEAFAFRDFDLCLLGHTHVPSSFALEDGSVDVSYGAADYRIRLEGRRWLINPGSVGFPRDAAEAHSGGNERRAAARYGLLDTDTLTWAFRRAEYDMRETATRMRRFGLW